MSALQTEVPTPPRWAVEYVEDAPASVLAQPDVLAVFGFGQAAPRHQDPRYLRIAAGTARPGALEVWRGRGPVTAGRDGDIAWAEDGALQFGAIELDEAVGAATQTASRRHRSGLRAPHRFPAPARLSARAADLELLRRHHRRRRRRRALSPLLRRPRARPRHVRRPARCRRPPRSARGDGMRTPAGVLAGRAHAGHAAGEPAPAQRLPLPAPVRPAVAEIRPRDAAAGRWRDAADAVGHRRDRRPRVAARRRRRVRNWTRPSPTSTA